MSHESGHDRREAADSIAARYAGKARAVMRRAAVASMADSKSPQELEAGKGEASTPAIQREFNFCPGCEFVRIMNPDGVGYCKEHGDIQ